MLKASYIRPKASYIRPVARGHTRSNVIPGDSLYTAVVRTYTEPKIQDTAVVNLESGIWNLEV